MANFFIDLFNMSITASYLVLAVVIARALLKKAPKWITCLLWAMVGFRLICPFTIESALSLIPGTQTITANETSVIKPFTVQSGITGIDTSVNEFLGDKYAEGVTVPTNTFADVTTVLSVIWLVGLICMLIYGFISYIRLRKRVGVSLLFKDNIYYCDNIDTPFILGFFKPKIYVPSGISEEQTGYITLHEKAHLKRKDHFWKPLGFLLLSVYWFNPVMWVAYILLCRDIESACDEKVIKNMDNSEKKNYSETLVSCSVQRRMVMACPLAFGEVGVKQRIKSVLNYKKPAFWIIILAFVLFTVVAVCFITNPVNTKLDRILNEDGYEVFSTKEQSISIDFVSSNLTDKMFEKDGVYKVRSRCIINDCVEFNFKEVQSHDDMFTLTFDVTYENLPDDGTIYVVGANQFDGGLELGDEISVSDPFGYTVGVYSSYCHSIGPGTEFSFSVPKKWFENRRDNKIVVTFDALAVVFEKSKTKGNSSSIGIIGGADGPTSIIVSDKNDEKEIKKLQEKYPNFFGLNTENGVTVYVTKLSQHNFECYLTSNTNPTDPQKVLHYDEFSSIDEMKLILSTYNLSNEEITVTPFIHCLSSYIGDESEYDATNISLLLGLNLYNENVGELKQVHENYYQAIIDSKSELRVYGLYYKDEATEEYLLVDRIGFKNTFFVVHDEKLFYLSDGRLKSVGLNGDFKVTVYANGIYSSKQEYSIERIELVQDGKIYCKADRWGETLKTKNNRETVYLAIKTDNSTYDEISKNDVPIDASQFEDILTNIETTLNTTAENILVKNFRIRYTQTGNIEDAIFNVWIYNGTKANEDFWIEGNIIITFDNTAFFNVINEEIVLLSEYNPKNDGSMQTIDEIIGKVKTAILGTRNTDKEKTQPEYYLLTMDEEKYVEYVANAESGVTYLQEKNESFYSASKPHDLTSQSYHLLNKMYFVLVPHYEKENLQNYVFEESETLVSGKFKVLLFDK
ncbi:MAG: hypothetical protein J6A49_11185 [Clostridia bacterium]|nr:hypothetical protein [Clostridia bacterium]